MPQQEHLDFSAGQFLLGFVHDFWQGPDSYDDAKLLINTYETCITIKSMQIKPLFPPPLIDPMLKNGDINLKLWKQSMRPNVTSTELAHLYFLPKPHKRFLDRYSENHRIYGMTIDTITRFTRLVLDTNCFYFEKKYYQQICGGAMESPLTMTLANIYMLEWEQPLIEHQKSHHELYVRYIDDVFMTTNALAHISVELNRVEKNDENIRITRSIGSTLEFLDVLVTNDNGQLKTSVFHKPAAGPYILPYLSDHPRHIHRSTVKLGLLRAARLCSHVDDFDQERLNSELTLLLNGYPPKFIAYHFRKFFHKNKITSLMEQLNDDIYQEFHRKLLLQPTRWERHQQSPQNCSNQKQLFIN
ncbi:unnamed protein product [Didymodactylos carnosus]|uniref:Helix-turn-helix domain-containing protein n=1 Tax=Didymodactylos carnosus TaxID=1234261 RepID=A0A814E356_9BILA|nr:unnamed protein product [Didymodactylos carnosus]CAF3735349.1 unnamed protein product [Didymodactylos carnosus]